METDHQRFLKYVTAALFSPFLASLISPYSPRLTSPSHVIKSSKAVEMSERMSSLNASFFALLAIPPSNGTVSLTPTPSNNWYNSQYTVYTTRVIAIGGTLYALYSTLYVCSLRWPSGRSRSNQNSKSLSAPGTKASLTLPARDQTGALGVGVALGELAMGSLGVGIDLEAGQSSLALDFSPRCSQNATGLPHREDQGVPPIEHHVATCAEGQDEISGEPGRRNNNHGNIIRAQTV